MEPLLFAGPGETLRFVPASRGFLRRTRLVNGLLGGWSIVFGSGSWLEAHLVARLGLASRQLILRGCGISEQEVWDLVQQERRRDRGQAALVVLCDSISGDQGRALMRRLRGLHQPPRIVLLVQDDRWLTTGILAECQAQAIVHQQSFGSGAMIRALQAIRRGHPYVDPRLQERLQQGGAVSLSGREQQVLEGLARGWTNKQIAEEIEIAATTVRDYVGTLCRKLDAANRTEAVGRAMALGVLPGRA